VRAAGARGEDETIDSLAQRRQLRLELADRGDESQGTRGIRSPEGDNVRPAAFGAEFTGDLRDELPLFVLAAPVNDRAEYMIEEEIPLRDGGRGAAVCLQ
jgi:hypothetical protein